MTAAERNLIADTYERCAADLDGLASEPVRGEDTEVGRMLADASRQGLTVGAAFLRAVAIGYRDGRDDGPRLRIVS